MSWKQRSRQAAWRRDAPGSGGIPRTGACPAFTRCGSTGPRGGARSGCCPVPSRTTPVGSGHPWSDTPNPIVPNAEANAAVLIPNKAVALVLTLTLALSGDAELSTADHARVGLSRLRVLGD